MSVNRTVLQGRFVRDPELRTTQSGKNVVSFTIAWSSKYKDSEKTLFLPCVAWGKLAEFVAKYFKKGSAAIVDGEISTRKWQDRNGNNRETVELTAERVHFCGGNTQSNTVGEEEPSAVEISDDEDLPF